MLTFTASWVLPVNRPPIRDGRVAVEDGTVVWVGGPREAGAPDGPARDAVREQLFIQQQYREATASVRPMAPTLTVTDAMTLHRGGREIRLLFLGRGHTGGDLVVYLPKERVLAPGDLLVAGVSYLGDAYVTEWSATLDRLRALDFDWVLPGHGEAFQGKAKIDHFQAYLADFWQQATALHDQGLSAEEAARRIDLRKHLNHYPAVPALKDQTDAKPGRTWLRWLTARDTLVMGQLALSFVMLTVAGLFVRGAMEGAATDPGFTFERGILVNVDTTLVNYTPERSKEFFRTLLDDLQRMPGVTSASLASHMPFGEFENSAPVQLPGPRLRTDDPAATGKVFSATTASISGDYFRTLGVPMRRGREFTDAEAFSAGGDRIALTAEIADPHRCRLAQAVGYHI